MEQARLADVVGRENICDNVLVALARAKALHDVFPVDGDSPEPAEPPASVERNAGVQSSRDL
jgi:hypothetical protein